VASEVTLASPGLTFSKVGVPVISGTAKVGSTLKVSAKGTWKPAPATYSYQWLRDGAEISGANAASYALAPADAGAAIKVKVEAKKDGYYDTWSPASKATSKVALGSLSAKTPVGRTPAGKDMAKTAPVFGQTLSVTTSAWSPIDTVLAYQWFRGKTLVGSGPSYAVQAADLGKTLVVKAIGTLDGYKTVVKASAASKKVAAAKITGKTPLIVGEPALGAKLSVDTAGWSPAEVSFKYQWLRDGKAISNATGPEYTTSATADKAKSISVKVTGSLPGHTKVSKTSAKVKVGVLSAVVPKVVNDSAGGKDPAKTAPRAGDKLSVKMGVWGPGAVNLTVEWYRSGTKTPVGVGEVYQLVGADIGKTVKARVKGVKAGFTTVSKDSAASKKVGAFQETVLDGNTESPLYNSTPSSQKTTASIQARAEAVVKAGASLMTLQESPPAVTAAIAAEAKLATGHTYEVLAHSDQAVIWDATVWRREGDPPVMIDLSSAKGGLILELVHIASGKKVKVSSIHMPTLKSAGQPNGYSNNTERLKDIKSIAKKAAASYALMGGDFNTAAHRAAILELGWSAALPAGKDTFDDKGTQAIDGAYARGVTFSGTKLIDPGTASDHKWITAKIAIK
jgi:hypothetical protein